MTVKEIIDALREYADDLHVEVWDCGDCLGPVNEVEDGPAGPTILINTGSLKANQIPNE